MLFSKAFVSLYLKAKPLFVLGYDRKEKNTYGDSGW